MLFAKVFISLFFIHFQCVQIIRMGYTYFLVYKYKDPVCSEFTATQCIYLGVVFAFTYIVSAFITVGNHDFTVVFLFFFFSFFFFLDILHMSTACCPQ